MKGFKGVLALSWPIGLGLALSAPRTLAQSGVISGPPQVQPAPGGTAQQDGSWIAVAGGFDGKGRRVSVGYSGYQRSREDAEAAAIRACRRNEPNVACINPFAVSSGCLYITPGEKSGGGVTWGRGATRDIAMRECRRGGYSCLDSKLIGGCLPGYN